VAAVAGGIVSTTSYVLIEGYRNRSFEENARSDAELGLLLAPERFSVDRVEELLTQLGSRDGFDAVARTGDLVFSSSPLLRVDDVPPEVQADVDAEELVQARTKVAGEPYLVVAGTTSSGGPELYFFFSRADLLQGLRDFRDVLLVGWLASLGAAVLLGRILTRRTLRPVREAAQASRDIAEGLLATRLDVRSDDEFGAWADAFNDMAAALEQKVNDLAAAATRERRFTADVAHELRTPLTSMVSASELLEDHLATIPVGARRPAELLIADVRRFRRLVLELLELARLDAASTPEQADEPQNEPLLLRDAMSAVVARSGLANVAIQAQTDGIVVLGDRLRFARVMGNLLANAAEHAGGPVHIAARREGDMIAIDVVDHGPGIAAEDLAHIFDRFHKSDNARTSHGPGLGLAIARQHAEAQGGTLRVANNPDGGACFTFLLPAAPGDNGS